MASNFRQIRVIIERDEDGIFVASVPALHGCHTQAQTYEKAVERIKEAIELYLEVLKERRELKNLFYKQPSFLAIEDLKVAV